VRGSNVVTGSKNSGRLAVFDKRQAIFRGRNTLENGSSNPHRFCIVGERVRKVYEWREVETQLRSWGENTLENKRSREERSAVCV
jgi:hypothetical protein